MCLFDISGAYKRGKSDDVKGKSVFYSLKKNKDSIGVAIRQTIADSDVYNRQAPRQSIGSPDTQRRKSTRV